MTTLPEPPHIERLTAERNQHGVLRPKAEHRPLVYYPCVPFRLMNAVLPLLPPFFPEVRVHLPLLAPCGLLVCDSGILRSVISIGSSARVGLIGDVHGEDECLEAVLAYFADRG